MGDMNKIIRGKLFAFGEFFTILLIVYIVLMLLLFAFVEIQALFNPQSGGSGDPERIVRLYLLFIIPLFVSLSTWFLQKKYPIIVGIIFLCFGLGYAYYPIYLFPKAFHMEMVFNFIFFWPIAFSFLPAGGFLLVGGLVREIARGM